MDNARPKNGVHAIPHHCKSALLYDCKYDTTANPADLKSKNPKTQKPKNFTARCENIIKMIRATFWVLVFAKY
jgi:hypothetical protein